MHQCTITIQCFGAMRDYGREIEISVPEGTDMNGLKEALTEKLGKGVGPLIAECALADERTVLGEDFQAGADMKLAILPPVCGG